MSDVFKKRNLNRILAGLPSKEYELLEPHLEKVSLKHGQILQMPEQLIEFLYFPTTCMISLLAALEGGETVETGVVGGEGMVGISVVLGVETSANEALVQADGEAYRMKAKALSPFIRNGGLLHDSLLRYIHAIFAQTSQTAACNRAHSLSERLARWLLFTHDRLGRDEFELTHEFLARMLGTRRAGVSVAASTLREAGMIGYTRGKVTIRNRQGLEDAACECYQTVRTEFDRLINS
jgi:CRP-like cAMP-binding protein